MNHLEPARNTEPYEAWMHELEQLKAENERLKNQSRVLCAVYFFFGAGLVSVAIIILRSFFG